MQNSKAWKPEFRGEYHQHTPGFFSPPPLTLSIFIFFMNLASWATKVFVRAAVNAHRTYANLFLLLSTDGAYLHAERSRYIGACIQHGNNDDFTSEASPYHVQENQRVVKFDFKLSMWSALWVHGEDSLMSRKEYCKFMQLS